jgi:hypothetical protein
MATIESRRGGLDNQNIGEAGKDSGRQNDNAQDGEPASYNLSEEANKVEGPGDTNSSGHSSDQDRKSETSDGA